MTGLLTKVMHDRADAAGTPRLDLDVIIAAGNRRVRRNRAISGLAAATVAGAVAVGSFAAAGSLSAVRPSDGEAAASPGFLDRSAAYAIGSTIHAGSRTFDVGRHIASLVQTDDGFVYTAPGGRVWLYDGTDSTEIGRSERNRLRADDTGSLVSWVALAEDGHPQYVVFDTAARAELARVDDDAAGPSLDQLDQGSQVFAVDDGSVYWRHGADLVRYDTDARTETVVLSDPRVSAIADVADGTFAFTVEGQQVGNHAWGVAVGARPDPDALSLAEATGRGALSPDGRLLAAEVYDAMAVYATGDRQDVTPHLEGYGHAVAYGWVDTDVAAVVALSDYTETSASGDVLECDVSEDACTAVSSFQDVAVEDLVLADGNPVT